MECKANRTVQSSETLLQSSKAQNALAKHISFMMASEEEPKITYKHSPMSDVPHVGIIGAGLAGLRCADILIQNGIRVTILEARNRIGGRVSEYKLLAYEIISVKKKLLGLSR